MHRFRYAPIRFARWLNNRGRAPRVSICCGLGLAVAALILFHNGSRTWAADGEAWQKVTAPGVWKSPPKGKQGYGWYRCLLSIPASWQGRDFELFVEPVDDAREYYLNGTRVGTAGSLPPEFRSGLGAVDRFRVPAGALQFGAPVVFSIRVYDSDGRGGFNVATPVLFGGDEAIRMEGAWQFHPGDNPEWSKLPEDAGTLGEFTFAKVVSATEATRILRRLSGEEGPLTIDESLRRFKLPEGLEVELAVGEPEVVQPLSFKFDARGRMWVVQYLQYPNPAGLTMVSRDKFLRSVYDKTPLPPPHHFRGADKITIHEDTDGDGRYDKHGTFVDGLSLASSFEFDRDGVWVLNPPYLLFYPDKNHDDVPDGDPEVHLEGFGIEDSHSIANNLRWGPDGWLYAAQGSTVTGNVRRYGSKDKPVHSMGQVIWRYQPKERRFEIFAEGGGNAFGVEFDAQGRLFSGHNGGDTRGFHYVQGGYYQKGFGKHGSLSNPFAFGYFPQMAHHSVPRFTHAFVIYEGGALGEAYEGRLFGVAPLLSHVVYSQVTPVGSTFKTADIGHALSTNDTWCRPVDIQAGPDGALYVADMYEQRIDHASHYQGRIDRSSGRIYRIKSRGPQAPRPTDWNRLSATELVDALGNSNKWVRQTAQRLLAERADPAALRLVEQRLMTSQGQVALEYLWAIQAGGALSDARALAALGHEDPYVRSWAVRLVGDRRQASPEFAAALVELAYREPHVEVRSQLACTARRLPADQGLPIVARLLTRSEDATDGHLPLLVWWAIETNADSARDAVVSLFQDPQLWKQPLVQQHILERLMRRFAQAGSQKDLLACARLLELAPADEQVKLLMTGFEKAFEGRSLSGLPDALVAMMAKRGGGSLALRLRQGEPEAIREALARIVDEKAKKAERLQLLQILGQVHPAGAEAAVLKVVEGAAEEEIRLGALSALQGFDAPAIGERLTQLYPRLSKDGRETVQSLLASRPAWSRVLLAAVAQGTIEKASIPASVVRRMFLHRDQQVVDGVRQHWGELHATNADELRALMERVTQVLGAGTGNPYKGHAIYKTTCGKCHRLFDDGGSIGPDLTAYKRDDLPNMLVNIVNPSLQIREGFESFLVFTGDGRTLNGFIADQDNRVVVLRTPDGQTLVIDREEIEEMQASPQSIMPEGVLKELDEQQLRDLFAYLRATQPLPQ